MTALYTVYAANGLVACFSRSLGQSAVYSRLSLKEDTPLIMQIYAEF